MMSLSSEEHVSFVTNAIKRTLTCRDGILTMEERLIQESRRILTPMDTLASTRSDLSARFSFVESPSMIGPTLGSNPYLYLDGRRFGLGSGQFCE
jgi:hypothetical protein